MRLLVFGATGATGRQLVRLALESGHHVTAFVREPARLTMTSDRLDAVTGDVMLPATVDAAVPGHEAVLVALGTMPEDRQDRHRRRPRDPVCSVGTGNIVSSMIRHGVRRLVVETSLGVGESRSASQMGAATLVRCFLKDVMDDKERQEANVRRSQLDWTLVRPARLTNGPRTSGPRWGESLKWSLMSTVSRADVAAFMLGAIADTRTYFKALSLIS